MPTPLELAEDFTLYLRPRAGFVREVRDDYVLTTGMSGGSVTRIRLGDGEVERASRSARRAFYLDGAASLLGAATLPRIRSRGVYFSLVHARWRDAVERGTPRLVVQAGPMSRPNLERIGFRTIGEIRLLVDRALGRRGLAGA